MTGSTARRGLSAKGKVWLASSLLAVAIAISVALSYGSATGEEVSKESTPRVVEERTLADGQVETTRSYGDGKLETEIISPSGERAVVSNEVRGPNGEKVICRDGSPLRIQEGDYAEPASSDELDGARRGLAKDQDVVQDPFSGELRIVRVTTVLDSDGVHPVVHLGEPEYIGCDQSGGPVLLSEADWHENQAEYRGASAG